MNIPKSINVKITLAPGKRQRESTKPFIAPSIEEIMAPGMAISRVRPRAGLSSPHAADQPSRLNPLGRAQRLGLRASLKDLKLVTSRTYAGIRTTSRKKTSSRYFTVRAAWDRGVFLTLRCKTAGAGAGIVSVVTSSSPAVRCGRDRALSLIHISEPTRQ